jgi:hypothetical protein
MLVVSVIDPVRRSANLAHRVAEQVQQSNAAVGRQTFAPLQPTQQEVGQQAVAELSDIPAMGSWPALLVLIVVLLVVGLRNPYRRMFDKPAQRRARRRRRRARPSSTDRAS